MDCHRRYPVRLLSLLVLMWGIYAPTIGYGYVYDDHHAALTAQLPSLSLHVASRQASSRSVALSAAIFGTSPRHFHVENLLLHAITGLALAMIAKRLFGSTAALVAVGLFWLHPIQAESVAYVSSRSELLMGLGIVLTLVCLLSRFWIVSTVGALCIGLLTLSTKEAAITLVALVPLVAWWTGAIVSQKWAPIVAIWKVLALVTVWHSASFWALVSWMQAPGYEFHLAQQTAAAYRLLALIVWPIGFTVDHDFGSIPIWIGTLSITATIGLAMLLWAKRHMYPSVAFACAWVFLALLPRIVLPSTPGFTEFLTEHHVYVPTIGLSLAAGSFYREGVCV